MNGIKQCIYGDAIFKEMEGPWPKLLLDNTCKKRLRYSNRTVNHTNGTVTLYVPQENSYILKALSFAM